MRKVRKNSAVLAAVLMLGFGPLHAGETTAPAADELSKILHQFMAGASVNDAAAHDRFWAPQLVYTSSNGTRFGKADIMQGMQSDASEQEDPVMVYTAEDVHIQQYGETAVVTFQLVGTPADGSAVLNFFNTGTFVEGDAGWQAVAWQATVIPPGED